MGDKSVDSVEECVGLELWISDFAHNMKSFLEYVSYILELPYSSVSSSILSENSMQGNYLSTGISIIKSRMVYSSRKYPEACMLLKTCISEPGRCLPSLWKLIA